MQGTPKPQPPREPDPSDCCGEGCANCVFDLYETALQRYREALAHWERNSRDSSGGHADHGTPDP